MKKVIAIGLSLKATLDLVNAGYQVLCASSSNCGRAIQVCGPFAWMVVDSSELANVSTQVLAGARAQGARVVVANDNDDVLQLMALTEEAIAAALAHSPFVTWIGHLRLFQPATAK